MGTGGGAGLANLDVDGNRSLDFIDDAVDDDAVDDVVVVVDFVAVVTDVGALVAEDSIDFVAVETVVVVVDDLSKGR